MSISKSPINQHKRMAAGEKDVGFKKGGGVMPAIKGQPMNPLTKAKMNNGIPGFKKGGPAKGCKC